jgi:hypothetical protein
MYSILKWLGVQKTPYPYITINIAIHLKITTDCIILSKLVTIHRENPSFKIIYVEFLAQLNSWSHVESLHGTKNSIVQEIQHK